MPFHVRVTLSKEEAAKVCKAIVDYFKPTLYICGYEEKGSNKHMHMHLEIEDETYLLSNAGKTYKSAFFKKIGYSGLYYFQQCKDPDANKLYVSKDLDIIAHNYDKEDFDKIINDTTKINENKKMNTRHKLLQIIELDRYHIQSVVMYDPEEERDEVYEERIDKYNSLGLIRHKIYRVYVHEWDKEPSPNIRSYALYIAGKLVDPSPLLTQQIEDYYNKD